MKELFLIRGLPGSGKSTFARKLLIPDVSFSHIEADKYFERDGPYEFDPSKVRRAHEWCYSWVSSMMETSTCRIVVSNTFTREKELQPYLALAEQHGYNVTTLIVENRHEGVSVHDVPRETIDKMRNRFSVKL